MLKTGIAFLFGSFTHLIIIYIFGGYLWMKNLEVGGAVDGDIANQVPSILYNIFYIELLISLLLIGIGIYGLVKKRNNE